MSIGINFKKIRILKGKTVDEVCHENSLSKEFLCKLEKDQIEDITFKKIQKLIEYYNIDIFDLIRMNLEDSISEDLKKFINKENIEYLQLGLNAKNRGLSTKKLRKTIELLSIEKKVGLFPRTI